MRHAFFSGKVCSGHQRKNAARASTKKLSMSRVGISHLAILVTALSAAAPWSARADAPPGACKFLTIDQVSAALGTPVTAGGKTSTVDHVGATVSSCM
jgi:hypothetical protein